MGLKDLLKRLVFGREGRNPETAPTERFGLPTTPVGGGRGGGPRAKKDGMELSRRLGLAAQELEAFRPAYHPFTIPKRKGGQRKILAPAPPLKELQKRILRRLLSRLRVHPAVRGFERGQSIVTHARVHARKAVVLHMDIKDFFPSTSEKRVAAYFRAIGWDKQAAGILTRLCTHEGSLPQGAPTSPRLSNLVNFRLDARLVAVAAYAAKNLKGTAGTVPRVFAGDCPRLPGRQDTASGNGDSPSPRRGTVPVSAPVPAVAYTRYADDLTFSFDVDDRAAVQAAIRMTKAVVKDEGYELHQKKKLRIMRRHDRQIVTGLVVNDGPRLPRDIRRRLRAVRHHLAAGKPATLTAAQLAGWDSLQKMVAAQSGEP